MSFRRSFAFVLLGACAGAGFGACDDGSSDPQVCQDDSQLTLFDRKIKPLLTADHATTCNQCHLAGVDLGLYGKGDECTTMACMVESKIVDLDSPEDSVVLTWILRAQPDSSLITDDVIKAEHDAVLEWIRYHATCNPSECADIEDPCGKGPTAGTCETPPSGHDDPPKSFDDPGDCSDLTLEKGFSALVYSWRGRCYPCHYDSKPGEPKDAPRYIVDGACDIGSLETMHNVIDLGLVDVDDPEQSLLLLKPLAESLGGVEHGGGDKFDAIDDGAYKDFKRWIDRYVACQNAAGG